MGTCNFFHRGWSFILLLVLTLVAGCMVSPLHEQTLKRQVDGSFPFGGYVLDPNARVEISWVHDYEGVTPYPSVLISPSPTGLPEASPVAVEKRKTWYRWGKYVPVPYDVWSQVQGQRKLAAQVTAKQGNTNLATFDLATFETCVNQNKSGGLIGIIENCRRKTSDAAVVKFLQHCGVSGESCCKDNDPCDGEMNCGMFYACWDAETQYFLCGAYRYNNDYSCLSLFDPSQGACGGAGQPCCINQTGAWAPFCKAGNYCGGPTVAEPNKPRICRVLGLLEENPWIPNIRP